MRLEILEAHLFWLRPDPNSGGIKLRQYARECQPHRAPKRAPKVLIGERVMEGPPTGVTHGRDGTARVPFVEGDDQGEDQWESREQDQQREEWRDEPIAAQGPQWRGSYSARGGYFRVF